MTIPKYLKIGAHDIVIKIEQSDFEPEACGETDYRKNTIVIDGKLPETQQGATLIHEILHYINASMDHTLLESLSQQLYQVLHDNKMLK